MFTYGRHLAIAAALALASATPAVAHALEGDDDTAVEPGPSAGDTQAIEHDDQMQSHGDQMQSGDAFSVSAPKPTTDAPAPEGDKATSTDDQVGAGGGEPSQRGSGGYDYTEQQDLQNEVWSANGGG